MMMTDQHEKQLRLIELALNRIADALEALAGKIDRVTGRDDRGRGYLRTFDMSRE
jgi:hypothetical protein